MRDNQHKQHKNTPVPFEGIGAFFALWLLPDFYENKDFSLLAFVRLEKLQAHLLCLFHKVIRPEGTLHLADVSLS